MSGARAITNNISAGTTRATRDKARCTRLDQSPSVAVAGTVEAVVVADARQAVDRETKHCEEPGDIHQGKGPNKLVDEMVHDDTVAQMT